MPLMLGHATASVLSGQWIARTGRLRPNALAGPFALAIGMVLLWRLTAGSTIAEAARDMVIAGLGIGLMNQVFLLTVQNSVPRRLIGAGSALVQFSRVLGGCIGVAVMGTVVNSGLPHGSKIASAAESGVGALSAAERSLLAHAIQPAFLVATAAALAVLAIAAWGIEEIPLRKSVDEESALAGAPGPPE